LEIVRAEAEWQARAGGTGVAGIMRQREAMLS